MGFTPFFSGVGQISELDSELLQLVRCPVTKSKLHYAEPDLITHVNDRIEAGTMTDRLGQKLDRCLDGGLVNDDQSLLMPIRDGIITLVSDYAIDLKASN